MFIWIVHSTQFRIPFFFGSHIFAVHRTIVGTEYLIRIFDSPRLFEDGKIKDKYCVRVSARPEWMSPNDSYK